MARKRGMCVHKQSDLDDGRVNAQFGGHPKKGHEKFASLFNFPVRVTKNETEDERA